MGTLLREKNIPCFFSFGGLAMECNGGLEMEVKMDGVSEKQAGATRTVAENKKRRDRVGVHHHGGAMFLCYWGEE
jgi:hypothetical protein